jgi:thiol-disulfide isomerase/thioredoxin
VTVLVRRDRMRAAKRMQDLLAALPNVRIWYNKEIKEILGDEKEVTGIMLYDSAEKTTKQMPIDGVFIAVGHYPNSELVASQVKCDHHGYIIPEGRSQRTSVPGFFVAGDVADPVYRQVVTAQGMGCMAALDADRYLNNQGFSVEKLKEIRSNLYTPSRSEKSVVKNVKSKAQLDEIINAEDRLVVVDFYADYCPSCIAMLPAFEQIAREMQESIVCIKVDTEQSEELVTHYKVERVPYLVVLKKGKIIQTYTTAQTLQQLRDNIGKLVQ